MVHNAFLRSCVMVAALGAGSIHSAYGQLVGPIPASPPPAPDFTPPPVPTREIGPGDTTLIAPSIVDLDAQGDLKLIEGLPDLVAVERYPFDLERRAKIRAAIDRRQVDADRFAITHLEQVLKALQMYEGVQQAQTFTPLFEAREVVQTLRYERPLDRLQRDGAISVAQRNRLDAAVRDYEIAVQKHLASQAGNDPTRQAVLVLRNTFNESVAESVRSIERQWLSAASTLEPLAQKAKLPPAALEQVRAASAQLAAVPAGLSDVQRREHTLKVLLALPIETQKAVLLVQLDGTPARP